MNKLEVEQVLSVLSIGFGKKIDDDTVNLAELLFKDFNKNIMQQAALNLVRGNETNGFLPNLNTLITEYGHVYRDKEIEQRAKEIESYNSIVNQQEKCPYCNNDGYILIPLAPNSCGTYLRCTCAHGRNLNVFSKEQLNIENKKCYIPTFEDILTIEEANIFKAEKTVKDKKIFKTEEIQKIKTKINKISEV